jgi:exodeoxyribonuclease V beta subunit
MTKIVGKVNKLNDLDLNGPLPRGTEVLEASAGTGKTYALSHRVLRIIAEQGDRVDSILVVTFTRSAAGEIRRRIRAKLELAATALAMAIGSPGEICPDLDDTLTPLINRWQKGENPYEKLLRILVAIDQIDLAQIHTIHGFIKSLIRENCHLLGIDPQVGLQENNQELLGELVTHWRRCELSPSPSPWQAWVQSNQDLRADCLLRLAQLVDDDRDMELPNQAGDFDLASHWFELEQRFTTALKQHGKEAAAAMVMLCKGKGNESPTKLLAKTKLAELPTYLEIARKQFFDAPSPAKAKTYRQLCSAFATSRLREVLADPDRAPQSRLHQLAEQLCYQPLEILTQKFCETLRQQASKQRREKNLLSFSDLLEKVDPAKLNIAQLQNLKEWAQRKFSCCLIDEFQDTDPIQWRLFAALFDQVLPITLIGDPKQAIYRFRGGDIRTYLAATIASDRERTELNTNRRSDPQLLMLLNRFFDVVNPFGSPAIPYRSVQAPSDTREFRLRFAADQSAAPPVRLRWITTGDKPNAIGGLVNAMAKSIASDLQNCLNQGLEKLDGDHWREIHPGDLAVLVSKNSEAIAIQRELLSRGISARIGRGGNIWGTAEAGAVALALGALAAEGRKPPALALALSPLGGFNATELSNWQDQELGAWLFTLHKARERYQQLGPLPALEVLLADGLAISRLGACLGGSQRVSDLLQLGELLQENWQNQGRPSAARLGIWLRDKRCGIEAAPNSQQRLVAASAMVCISTIHASKGLEFPLVWCPTLWRTQVELEAEEPFRAWDQARQRRILELSRRDGNSPRRERRQEAILEAWQEGLRLGYVALTRACHQICFDWGRIRDSAPSLPAWLLHKDLQRPGSDQPWQEIAKVIRENPDLQQVVQRRCLELGIQFELAPPNNSSAPFTTQKQPPIPTQTNRPLAPLLPRSNPASWGRWSYSRLVESKHANREYGREEEGFDPDNSNANEAVGAAESCLWSPLPAGAAFGTLVHEVLEKLDFDVDLNQTEAQIIVRDAVARSGFEPNLSFQLLPALNELLQRPLGGPLGNLRLNQIKRVDTLRELPFDLPLSGFEDGPPHDVLGDALKDLATHPDQIVSSYAKTRLNQRVPQWRAGFLNGVIDLVFRATNQTDQQQWVVLDWKTNRLNQSMAALMAEKDYWLQAQLYRSAIQRWLQIRLDAAMQKPIPVHALMLFTRNGETAWLLDPTEAP